MMGVLWSEFQTEFTKFIVKNFNFIEFPVYFLVLAWSILSPTQDLIIPKNLVLKDKTAKQEKHNFRDFLDWTRLKTNG